MGLPDLVWFPKPFGPGDLDGSGEKKVLGRPEVDFVSLLVRETAQNSWDARLPGVTPRFELRLRELDDSVRDVLTWNVFGQRPAGSPLDDTLSSPVLTALEVVDRGTKGLGGPTQNSIPQAEGDLNDYASFILTVGAPPEDLWAGGSYGFGKTAGYLASRCSTIVVWSRSRTEAGGYVERLVASAMGRSFDHEARRFTGRQWWGLPPTPRAGAVDDVLAFEPLDGEEARRLGEALFERHFDADETGLSILIIQFAPEGQEVELEVPSTPREIGGRLAFALAQNLWTKLDVEQPSEWRMDCSVWVAGEEVPIPSFEESPVLDGLRRCLQTVRALQAGEPQPYATVQPITTSRYGVATGHLALTQVIQSDHDPLRGIGDAVALMRHRAELVVRYEPVAAGLTDTTRWVGVFKPLADLDPLFQSAEPPAHDSWAHVEGLDNRTKSIIKVTLRCIRDEVRAFLAPEEPVVVTDDVSTGALASALSGLSGGLQGVGASRVPGRPGQRRGGRRALPVARVLSVEPLARSQRDIEAGRQRTAVSIVVEGASEKCLVGLAGLALAVDGGTMRSAGEVVLDHWTGGTPNGTSGVVVTTSEVVRAVVSFPAGMAISFSVQAEESV